ncbi:MAG TPA: acyl-CoA dehydrogenase [Micromonosporaceae bacterium]
MIAITADEHAIAASIQRRAAAMESIAAVRAMAEDAAHADTDRLWRGLADLGLFALGLPEPVGGTGTVVDLAVALEQVTDALVPGPIMPTVLAGLLLAPHADMPAVKDVLPAIVTGDASVAVAWGPGPVLGAGATTHLLLPHAGRWLLVASDDPAVSLRPLRPLDFSRPLAVVSSSDVDLNHAVALTADTVRDTAALLGAIEAAAVASWCVRTATRYATQRRQFDRPIGSFQAIKHLLAGMLCRSERACALAWDACVAYGQSPEEFPLAAAVTAAVAMDAGVENAKDCIQVLGGIGFTWQHDAHLYLRRAMALRQLLGDGAVWRQRAADLALAGVRRGGVGVGWPGADELPGQLRDAVGSEVRQIAELPQEQQRAALADAGLLTPGWPRPYGRSAAPAEQIALDEQLVAHGIVRPDIQMAAWVLPTIIAHGTHEQRERFVGPSLRGEITWCQLFSEPEAGSDLASLRTRAVRVDDGWLLTGQKVWTSLAHEAHWGICLARTDPQAPRHQGLTYFLVPMDSPGLEIRPLREITGHADFNEVFLDDVFVPDRFVVGTPGDGWRLARGTLEHERVAIGRGGALGEAVEGLLASVRAAGTSEDRGVRDRIGGLVADSLAVSTMELRATLRRLAGEPAGAESAVRKLVGVAHRQAVAEASLLLCGAAGAAVCDETAEPVHEFLLTRCLSIAGGTTQILLDVVAERVLGLPRERGH